MTTPAELALGYGDNDLTINTRVEIHPAMDNLIQGGKFGTIIEIGRPERGETRTRYHIRMDKSWHVVVLSSSNVREIK